jgi:hypothetical protein
MTIEERVETLERNLLRARLNQRRILTAAIAAVSLIGLISAATPEQAAPSELQAKRFVLLDKKGVIRASLDANDDAPGLELFDEQGKSRAIFYASKTQSGMTLRTAS